MTKQASMRRDYARLLLHGSALVAVAFAIIVRVRLLDVPLERDEGESAYIGQLILQGLFPSHPAYSMKLPGVQAMYALIMAVFGETPRGIHLGLLLANLAAIALLFLLARRLFDSRAASVAAAAYAILSLNPAVYGFIAHGTHFVVLSAVAGTLLLFDAVGKQRGWRFFVAGNLFGLAFVMKQHGFFFILFGAASLVLELRKRGTGRKEVARAGGQYCLGATLPFVLCCVFFALSGSFRTFWFWTFEYASAYVSVIPFGTGIRTFFRETGKVIGFMLPIWILAIAGVTTPLWDNKGRDRAGTVFLFLTFSFLAICPGFYFRGHYYILVLPVVALLAGMAMSAALRRWEDREKGNSLGKAACLVYIAALLVSALPLMDYYFLPAPRDVVRKVYGLNPFPEAVTIAEKIRALSGPDDLVAVLGSEPEIYFYANRRSVTGHLCMYGLMEPQPFASRMQRDAISEIEAARPKHIVFVNDPNSWLVRSNSDMSIFLWMERYVGMYYDRIGVVDILSKAETVSVWGNEAAAYKPRSRFFLLLFERKGKPL